MQILDLSGKWRCKTDEEDCGLVKEFFKEQFSEKYFFLPGSACENGIGKEKHYAESYSREIMRCPVEKYEYFAPLWLQKEIEIPKEFEGKRLRIYLERVNIASELWFDGRQIGRQTIELSAPHVYFLPRDTVNGRHTLTLRVDNRDLVNMADMASGYSVDTQGIWNGVIGKIELQAEETIYPEKIQVYPQENGIRVRLTTVTDIHTPMTEKDAVVIFSLKSTEGKWKKTQKENMILWTSRQNDYFEIEMDAIRWWDEFSPDLYEIKAEIYLKNEQEGNAEGEEKLKKQGETVQTFGMRLLRRDGRRVLLNNRQISFRGTIDCAQFPLTGYPPMDRETWNERMAVFKKYGFNHIRFHAWCPPKAAFEAADEAGIYLSVEMPMWLNLDISKVELGIDPIHAEYYRKELFTILEEYGNHPSFLLFSNGNENMGDFALMNQLTIAGKAYDPRHLYTTTSNFDHPVQDCEDYFSAFQVRNNWVRLQNIQDQVAARNDLDYRAAVEAVDVPVISFEVGQYCVYPDVDVIESYTGNIMPVNFEMVRKLLKAKKVYHRRKDYVRASGSLALKLYKEDVEAAMRTKEMGGFQLLSFQDYTGQSLATVGLLDIFLKDKDVEELSQWTEFCNDVVPLFISDRTISNTSVWKFKLSLYDFGKERIKNPVYQVRIDKVSGGKKELFRELQTTEEEIQIHLNEIESATMLLVRVSIEGNNKTYTNRWRVYVYPDKNAEIQNAETKNPDKNAGITYIDNFETLQTLMENGGKGIVDLHLTEKTIQAAYIPVFWSPVHFPTDKPCGAIIQAEHPIFADFPTENSVDYQWKTLLDHGVSADISAYQDKVNPMMELVPNFTDNTANGLLFEAKMKKAKILFCGFELKEEDLPTKQLKESILKYMSSDAFDPQNELAADEIHLSKRSAH